MIKKGGTQFANRKHIYIPDIYKALGNPKSRFCGSFKALVCILKPFMLNEEGYSILTETFTQKVFLVSDNKF